MTVADESERYWLLIDSASNLLGMGTEDQFTKLGLVRGQLLHTSNLSIPFNSRESTVYKIEQVLAPTPHRDFPLIELRPVNSGLFELPVLFVDGHQVEASPWGGTNAFSEKVPPQWVVSVDKVAVGSVKATGRSSDVDSVIEFARCYVSDMVRAKENRF